MQKEQTMTENKLIIGTAPDSWGVWFADDPKQTPWERFLDEGHARAGHREAPAAQHGRLVLGRLGELLEQTALADAGLAADDGDDWLAGAGARQSAVEGRQLAGASDETDLPSCHGLTLPWIDQVRKS